MYINRQLYKVMLYLKCVVFTCLFDFFIQFVEHRSEIKFF